MANRWGGALARSLALLGASLLAGGCRPAERAARNIAARNAEARGGLAAWRAVQSLSLAGHLDAGSPRDQRKLAMDAIRDRNAPARRAAAIRDALDGKSREPEAAKALQLPFLLELARPHRSRLEILFAGQAAIQIFDGQSGWKLRPFLGRREVEAFSEEELRLAREQTALDGPLMDWAASARKLELVGDEVVDGRSARKIAVTGPDNEIRHVWVDSKTSLEVRIDGIRRIEGTPRTVYTYFRDYRPVDGLLIPHLLETVVTGVPGSERIVIEQVIVNPELAEDEFSRPSPVERGSIQPPPPPGPAPAPPAALPDGGAGAPKGAAAEPDPTIGRAVAIRLKRATIAAADYAVPEASLVRDDGAPIKLRPEMDDGRAVALNFIFTTCQGICPVMSQVFSQLQDRLGADRDKVHMMSVSLDPEQDTPPRLTEYAGRFHAGPGWRHYTGTAEASVAVQRAFDAWRGDKMNHTPVTFLRAAPGRRWIRVDGFASAEELAEIVRALLAKR